MAKKPEEEPSTGDAAEQFLRGLISTHEEDQLGQGLDEMAKMFYQYFQRLQESGFHYSKAFILTRDWHGMWWQTKFQHEMMHMHPPVEEQDEHS
jgi:hypothetical protein